MRVLPLQVTDVVCGNTEAMKRLVQLVKQSRHKKLSADLNEMIGFVLGRLNFGAEMRRNAHSSSATLGEFLDDVSLEIERSADTGFIAEELSVAMDNELADFKGCASLLTFPLPEHHWRTRNRDALPKKERKENMQHVYDWRR